MNLTKIINMITNIFKRFSTASTAQRLQEVRKTVLYSWHKDKMGARMVNFADYMMPVNYPLGGLKEHLHCRKSVGLFDVSHMG